MSEVSRSRGATEVHERAVPHDHRSFRTPSSMSITSPSISGTDQAYGVLCVELAYESQYGAGTVTTLLRSGRRSCTSGGGLVAHEPANQRAHLTTISRARDAGRVGAWAANPEPVPDSDLLRRCRTGDAEAWETLVGRYERLVFSVALRNGMSREDAADITQTTFIALLDAIDLLREDERLGSWLMTVARRQAWRNRRRTERVTGSLDQASAPADAIEDWERLAWLHGGLQQLGDPCRELLTALYLDSDSPSYATIAPRLNRAVGSIGPLRARCLARLREILGEAA